jgi:hypothetical protein
MIRERIGNDALLHCIALTPVTGYASPVSSHTARTRWHSTLDSDIIPSNKTVTFVRSKKLGQMTMKMMMKSVCVSATILWYCSLSLCRAFHLNDVGTFFRKSSNALLSPPCHAKQPPPANDGRHGTTMMTTKTS